MGGVGRRGDRYHVREHFFSLCTPDDSPFFFPPHCLALVSYRKDKLDHMLVPIKTLAVGIQELHHSHGKA